MEEWLKPENLMARFIMGWEFDKALAKGIEPHHWPTQELANIWTAFIENKHLGRPHKFGYVIKLIDDKPTRRVFIALYRNLDFMNTTVNLDWQLEGALGICQA